MSEHLQIQHDPSSRQFYVDLDGMRACLAYMDLGKKTLDIYRTFVPPQLRGRGVAAALTEEALAFASRAGYEVIPSCSYVEIYMARHKVPVHEVCRHQAAGVA